MIAFIFKSNNTEFKKTLHLKSFKMSAFNKNILTMLFMNNKKMEKKSVLEFMFFTN